MKKWFFLDRINMAGYNFPVSQRKQFAIDIFADTANPGISRFDPASMGAQMAEHLLFAALLKKICFFHSPPTSGNINIILYLPLFVKISIFYAGL